jgi:TPR repeat protein
MLLAAALLLLSLDPAQVRKQALAGNKAAQWEAAQLVYQGKLKGVSKKQAEQWRREAAERGVAQAQYDLGLELLDATAAEDEPRRFEGLAWLALAAEKKLPIAVKRWEIVIEQLGGEELEVVEQKAKSFRLLAVQPPKIAVQ